MRLAFGVVTALLFIKPGHASDLTALKASASKGDAPAQTILGSIYATGRDDIDSDEKEGLKWARLAADQGYPPALQLMGDIYLQGIGVEADPTEAVKWYRKAAEQGLSAAQYNLAVSCLTGNGVAKDEAEAVRWLRKAADQDDATAQNDLGYCLLNGQGVAKNETEGVKWLRRAAKNGSQQAMLNLAVCHMSGQALPKNLVVARAWAVLAEDGEEPIAEQARKARSQAEAEMSAIQIVDSAELIAEMMDSAEVPLETGQPSITEQQGTPKMIKSVQVDDGGTDADASAIKGRMLIREGGPFSDAMIETDLKRIRASGLVENFDIQAQDVDGGVKVIVKIIGLGVVEDIAFMGNTVLDDGDLLKSSGIKAGEPVDVGRLSAGQREILKAYQSKGYSGVTVDYSVVPSGREGFSTVVFEVNEGALGIINDIRFEGNTAINSNKLRGMLRSKEQAEFADETLQMDITIIEQALQDEGYVYARVTEIRREPVSTKKMNIVYVIDEGAKHDVESIHVSGNTHFSRDELMKGIQQKAGTPYNGSFIKADTKRIEDYYGSRGYSDTRVETAIEGEGRNRVKIDYHVEEGEKSMVGRVSVTGNVNVTKDIILNELKLAPGDLLNTVLIDKAKEALRARGYFRELDIRCNPSDEPGAGNIDIQVVEH